MNNTPKLLYIIFLILLTSCQMRVNYAEEKAHLENFCKYSEVLQFPFIKKPVLYKGIPFTRMVYSKMKWEKKGYAGTLDTVEKYRFKEGRLEGNFLTTEGSYPFDSQGGGEMYTIQIKGRINNVVRKPDFYFQPSTAFRSHRTVIVINFRLPLMAHLTVIIQENNFPLSKIPQKATKCQNAT